MDKKWFQAKRGEKNLTKHVKNKIRCLRPGDTRRHTIRGANDKKLWPFNSMGIIFWSVFHKETHSGQVKMFNLLAF